MGDLKIKQTERGVAFFVKVVPGSSRTTAAGLLDGMLKVKVAAPAEKGKANASLTKLLAEKLGVKKNAVTILSGLTSAVKEILIEGIGPEQILVLSKQ
jgi:uncharacterized protein (TIGR00251 family)